MMEHPKRVGDRTTLAVMLALIDTGYHVSVPFGENTRYDLIVDDGSDLQRVQCKTGHVRSGAVVFKTASSYAHHATPADRFRAYHGQIDSFAVYCPATGGVYLIGIDELPNTHQASLRFEPPRNSQRKRVRDASVHQLATIEVSGEPAKTARRSPEPGFQGGF